jgi:hypothetical protein
MIDLKDAVRCEMAEVFPISLDGLEIDRAHRSSANGDAGTGVVAEDLDDVIPSLGCPEKAPAFADVHGHARVLKQVPYDWGVPGETQLYHGRHQFDCIHSGSTVH